MKAVQLSLGEDGDLEVGGKQLVEGVLNGQNVAGGNNVPFQFGGGIQNKAVLLQSDGLGVVKPGI